MAVTLLALVLVPLVAAVAVAVVPVRLARPLALVAALGTAALTVSALAEYTRTGEPLAFSAASFGPGAFVSLYADGIALPLVALTALLGAVVVLVSWRVERLRAHVALLLALEAAVIAVFLAADLVLFYVAWEAVLIPMFFLIGGWGHEDRRRAAIKFFIYTFAGSALMLVALVLIVLAQGSSELLSGGATVLGARETLVFWLLAAGLLVKVPAWPLHTWLPDAHVEAPTAGSIMLAGVLLKMGGYGLIRLGLGYTPAAFAQAAPIIAVLGTIGIVYGAAVALGQSDLKRLVAYSSVAHMGFVLLALSTTSALGLQAAMLGMVSHGLVAGALFLLVGALYDRAHTREIAAFGGLGATMPRWGTAFVFASLASLGLPGLSGFPGEFGAVVAAFDRFSWPTAVVGLGVVLAGAYSLRAVRLVVHGEPRELRDAESSSWRDLDTVDLLALAPLVLGIIALGVWPRLVTGLADPSVAQLVQRLSEALR